MRSGAKLSKLVYHAEEKEKKEEKAIRPCVGARAVHRSSRVRFVPNPDCIGWGKSLTHNRPGQSFGSYRFRVHINLFWVRRSGAKSSRILAEIWPDFVRSG